MKWKSFLIVFIVTSVLAIVSLVACGRPEPVVQEQQTETSTSVSVEPHDHTDESKVPDENAD
jgi:hypothetical protein